ncbi:hypothetical protein V8G54_017992, partial [Vigna mungo]
KRNRLDHKKLHDLVCIKYNQQLAQRYNIRDEIDPIVLNDIDECTSSLGEPTIYTRRKASNKRKQTSSGGIIIASSQASKNGGSATLASTQRKRKETIQVGVDNELELHSSNSDSENTKELLYFNEAFFEGEKDGYAPLDNIEDDVGIEEVRDD